MSHPYLPNQLISFLLLFCLRILSSTAISPSTIPSQSQEFLDVHNQARALVGVPLLKWDPYLANVTSKLVRYQREKNKCDFANLTGGGKYGANQLWSGGTALTPKMAVGTWVSEKKYYNYADNSCAANHRCGVYKQVVWRNTTEVGCGIAECVKQKASLVICFYYPPGNYVGERPY